MRELFIFYTFYNCSEDTFSPPSFQKIPVTELHGLSSGRSFIEQGGVGDRQACDVTDHGLVVEERLQATLGDLGLVGRVLSHPENKGDTMTQQCELEHMDNGTRLVAFKGPRRDCGMHCTPPPTPGFWSGWLIWIWHLKENLVEQKAPSDLTWVKPS